MAVEVPGVAVLLGAELPPPVLRGNTILVGVPLTFGKVSSLWSAHTNCPVAATKLCVGLYTYDLVVCGFVHQSVHDKCVFVLICVGGIMLCEV